MAAADVIIGLIPDDYAVLPANGESAPIVVMGDVVTNYRIRCPYFKSIHQPPFPCLRIIITRTPFATDVACYGRRVRTGQTLYKDAAAISRPAHLVPRDDGVLPVEINQGVYTNIVDDVDINWEVALAIYHANNRRIVERARCCLGDKISFDISIGASINKYPSAANFDDRQFVTRQLLPVATMAANLGKCSLASRSAVAEFSFPFP
jgi:hypothetical protein